MWMNVSRSWDYTHVTFIESACYGLLFTERVGDETETYQSQSVDSSHSVSDRTSLNLE